MLDEALTTLAAAGGTAVVQAAGTDMWVSVRDRIARLFGRKETPQDRLMMEQLELTASLLASGETGTSAEAQRPRLEAAWQAQFESLLEHASGEEREGLAELLRDLIDLSRRSSQVSAGAGGLAAGGDINITATDSAIATGVLHGGIHLAHPLTPGPERG